MTTTADTDPLTEGPSTTQLIDTDVHEVLTSLKDLLPYLAPVWKRWVTEYTYPDLTTGPRVYAVPQASRKSWILSDGPFPGTDLDLMRQQLFDAEGVTTAIINNVAFHVSALQCNFEFAAALGSAYNSWQIETWLEEEPRLRGSVHVVAHDPQRAVREIDRVGDHPQMVQVYLPTVTDRQYGDPFYWPIYEAAKRHGLAIAFHHGVHTQTVLGFPRYHIEWHMTAAPHAAQTQLVSLICNGLFDKHPDLKVVFLETGVGWLPWFLARLDQQYRELRVDVPWVKRLPSKHIRECVRFSTQPLNDIKPADFAQMVEESGSERMFMFASDYPHYDADTPDAVLPKTLPRELLERIRYRNAMETYPKLTDLTP